MPCSPAAYRKLCEVPTGKVKDGGSVLGCEATCHVGSFCHTALIHCGSYYILCIVDMQMLQKVIYRLVTVSVKDTNFALTVSRTPGTKQTLRPN